MIQPAEKCNAITEAYVDEEETPLQKVRSKPNYDFTSYVEKYNARVMRQMINEVSSGKALDQLKVEDQKISVIDHLQQNEPS